MSTVEEQRAFKWMKASTRNHQMTIIRDDGLYRHIRFKEPGTGIWWFDLVTWPGHLVVTGDIEDFHFARIDDMFQFFRKPPGYINASYWSEKLRGPVDPKVYQPEIAKRMVFEEFWERRGEHPGQAAAIWRALRYQVLDDETLCSEESVHRALSGFRYRLSIPVEPESDFVPQLIPRRHSVLYQFSDTWEWDLRDYDWHFLVSLHAIVWGISQYDKAKSLTVEVSA
jgi:hypothetical protein